MLIKVEKKIQMVRALWYGSLESNSCISFRLEIIGNALSVNILCAEWEVKCGMLGAMFAYKCSQHSVKYLNELCHHPLLLSMQLRANHVHTNRLSLRHDHAQLSLNTLARAFWHAVSCCAVFRRVDCWRWEMFNLRFIQLCKKYEQRGKFYVNPFYFL